MISFFVVVASLIPDTIAPGRFRAPDDFDYFAGAVALVIAVALLFRRRRPVAAFVVALSLSIVVTAAGHSSLGCVLAVGVAVFELARSGRRATAIGAALVALLAVGTILIARSHESLPRVIGVLAVIGFAAAAGDAIHSRRALIQSVLERAQRAEQSREEEARRRVIQERLRIARELHDAAAHQIAVINLQAGAATAALAGDRRGDTEQALASIRTSAQDVLSEIAALLVVLRTDDSTDPTHLAPVRGLSELPSLLESFQRAGLTITGDHRRSLPDLPGAVDIVAYKVVQEALTNAHKHGPGVAHLDIDVVNTRLHLRVVNRLGPPRDVAVGSGHGITGARERVASVRGELSAGTESEEYVFDVLLPIDQEVPA